MTDAPSLGRRLLIWSGWTNNPWGLARVGLPLLVVGVLMFWSYFHRPEGLPESLDGLDRVVGDLDGIYVNYRDQTGTMANGRGITHKRKRDGWRLTLKTAAGQRTEWSIKESRDTLKLEELLKDGTRLTGYAREAQIFQLEGPTGVLVDLEETRASQHRSLTINMGIAAVALISGLLLCGRAVGLWLQAE